MGGANSKCGIFVAHSLHDVYKGLALLQHRGEDNAGIAALIQGGKGIDILRWSGMVQDFSRDTAEKLLEGGSLFIGEVRYSTTSTDKTDEELFEGALPRYLGGKITANYGAPDYPHRIIRGADFSIVHNGNLMGVIPEGKDTDTDVMLKYYTQQEKGGVEKIIENFPAAYSAAILDKNKDEISVFTDRYSIRPLWIGEKDGRLVASSEDRAISEIGGKPIRQFRPGEIISIPKNGTHFVSKQVVKRKKRPCFFERIYLGHVLSSYDGIINMDTRRRAGVSLALEYTPDVDFVSYIPNAPEDFAKSYADFRNIPFINIFYKIKPKRSFLGLNEKKRSKSIQHNLYVRDDIDLKGKRILLLDDSVVRFNNAPDSIKKLRIRDAAWVGLGVGTPPIGPIINNVMYGCDKGVDMPPLKDNFAIRRYENLEEMSKAGLLDSIYYISKKGLSNALRRPLEKCCAFCIGEPDPVLPEELIHLRGV